MKPEIIDLGFFSIKSYGLMITIGYILALAYGGIEAKRISLSVEKFKNVILLSFVYGFIGGRLLFVILMHSHYISHPIDIFAVWDGGYVFYGGIFSATLTAVYYFRKYELPILTCLDICAIGVPMRMHLVVSVAFLQVVVTVKLQKIFLGLLPMFILNQ